MRYFLFLGIVVSLFFGCSSETVSNASIENDSAQTDSLTLADVEFLFNYQLLQENYYWATEELEDPSVYYRAYIEDHEYGNVSYMYSMLSDDYTYYIEPDLLELFLDLMFSLPSEIGTGIEVDDSLKIIQVYTKSPADLSGIKTGDVVLAVDGIEIKQKATFERLTTGEEGDELSLTLLREEDILEVSVELFEFSLPTVMLDSVGGVPRIRVTEFSSESVDGGSYKEWIAALEKTHGATATIIDLRGNPGGEVETCLDMASEMLHKNDTLVLLRSSIWDEEIEEQWKKTEAILASTEGIASERYYVLLADSNSASCSETMMAALTQNKKTPVIGMRSYGKGIMQNLGLTPAEGLYSVTTAEILDKDGNSIHQRGFEPDFYSEDEEEIFAKALEFIELEQEREAGYGSKTLVKKTKSEKSTRWEKPGAYRFTFKR